MEIEKIISLWSRYVKMRGELRDSGISFTNRQPEADFSEFIAEELLCAKRVDPLVQKDYDLEKIVDGISVKYQVKSLSKSTGNLNGYIIKEKDRNTTSDYYIFVFFGPDYTLKNMYLVTSKFVKEFNKKQIKERDLQGNELKKEHCDNKGLYLKLFSIK